jgi:hypothetical protein
VTAPCSHVVRKRPPTAAYGFATSAIVRGAPWHETTTFGRAHLARLSVFAAALPWWGDCRISPGIL